MKYTEKKVRQDLLDMKTTIANCEMYRMLVAKYEAQLELNQGNKDYLLEKIEQFNKDIHNYIDESTNKADTYTKNIFKLKPNYQKVIVETYVNHKTRFALSIEMRYSEEWIRKMLRLGIKDLTKLMNEE